MGRPCKCCKNNGCPVWFLGSFETDLYQLSNIVSTDKTVFANVDILQLDYTLHYNFSSPPVNEPTSQTPCDNNFYDPPRILENCSEPANGNPWIGNQGIDCYEIPFFRSTSVGVAGVGIYSLLPREVLTFAASIITKQFKLKPGIHKLYIDGSFDLFDINFGVLPAYKGFDINCGNSLRKASSYSQTSPFLNIDIISGPLYKTNPYTCEDTPLVYPITLQGASPVTHSFGIYSPSSEFIFEVLEECVIYMSLRLLKKPKRAIYTVEYCSCINGGYNFLRKFENSNPESFVFDIQWDGDVASCNSGYAYRLDGDIVCS